MRILFVVPNVPSSIRPRPLNFIRGLSQNHQVSVVCLATNDVDERSSSELSQNCHSFEIVRLSRWRSLLNCLRALGSRQALRCAYFDSPKLRAIVRARVEAREVDLLHAEHLKTLSIVKPVLGKVPAVLDAVDCLSMLESRRFGVTKNPFLKIFSWIESRRFARSEAEASRCFNRIAISSSPDRNAYPVPPDLRNKIDVIPNGVDLDHFKFRQFRPRKNLLVFCAKLDYFPNEDAALYFTNAVWPRLRARRPELRLEIVGSRPPRSVLRMDGKRNVRIIGSVPDVRPYLGRAFVALCPIRIRAGIQNKMLEAMALGVPVVATSICCEGLSVVPGQHLLAAEDASGFASAIELLLDNMALRQSILESARAYVERYHNWSDSLSALLNSYSETIVDRTPHRGDLVAQRGTPDTRVFKGDAA